MTIAESLQLLNFLTALTGGKREEVGYKGPKDSLRWNLPFPISGIFF